MYIDLNIYCFLFFQGFPGDFSENNFNRYAGVIVLQTPDFKCWLVRCNFHNKRGRLGQGWHNFVVENDLHEGDVCVFELIKSTDMMLLKVTIFRLSSSASVMGCKRWQKYISFLKKSLSDERVSLNKRPKTEPVEMKQPAERDGLLNNDLQPQHPRKLLIILFSIQYLVLSSMLMMP